MSVSGPAAFTPAATPKPASTSGAVSGTASGAASSQGAPSPARPGQGAAVIVTLSVQAQASLQASTRTATTAVAAAATKTGGIADPAVRRYAAFFPTRDGQPATALAKAVSDPGAVSSSKGLDAADVAKDARARLDAQYKAMADSGKPFDFDSFEGRDWNTLMGGLDRRSLNAISSNAGGRFSEQEQQIAQSLMSQQQSLAMGLYCGPISQEDSFVNPFPNDTAAQMKAGVTFLDGVSGDEKSSIAWALSRSMAQEGYELNAGGDGKAPERLDSDSPLARLIKSAMDNTKGNAARGVAHGPLRTADDLKEQPWFKGFASRLDELLASRTTAAKDAPRTMGKA